MYRTPAARCKFMVSFIRNELDPLTLGPDGPFGEHRVRFGDLAWATAAVSSRAFTRLYGGGWVQESRPLLVPFMDMLNFNFDQENVKVNWSGRTFSCVWYCFGRGKRGSFCPLPFL